MLSQNRLDFWFPDSAGHWQKCQIITDVPSSTYQIFAKIAWFINFLSSILPPNNKKKGRCCHKMALISGFQMALGIDKNVRLLQIFLLWHTKFLSKLHGSINFLSSIFLPMNRKKGRCCHKMAQISGFQVVLGIDKNVRLSEMFLLWHTKFLPKLHGSLIFYLVFSFPGTRKRVDAVTKWPWFQAAMWCWALTKMSDCCRYSFFNIPIFFPKLHGSLIFWSSILLPQKQVKG